MSDRFLSFFNSRQNQISRPLPNLQIGLAASLLPFYLLIAFLPLGCLFAFSKAMNGNARVFECCRLSRNLKHLNFAKWKLCQVNKVSKSMLSVLDLEITAWNREKLKLKYWKLVKIIKAGTFWPTPTSTGVSCFTINRQTHEDWVEKFETWIII